MTSKHTIAGMIRRPIFGFFASHLGIQSLRSAVIRVVSAGLSLGIGILLARVLGVDGLGIYAGAMALVTLLAVPALSGVPMGLVQLISRYLASDDLGHARGMIRWGFGQVLSAGLVLAGISLIITVSLFWNEINTVTVYLLAFSLLPILCLTSVQRAILNAFEYSTISIIPQDIIRPVLLAAFLLAWIIFWPENRGNAAIAMSLQLLAFVLAFIGGALFLRKYRSRALPRGPRTYNFRQWYRMSLPFMMLAATEIVLSQTDIIMLSWWEPPASVGLYRVSTSAALLITLPAGAISTPLAPSVARLFQQQNTGELQRILTLSARWGFAGCLPIAFVLIWIGDWLLGVVYGQAFIAAYAVVVVLVLSHLFKVAVGPVGLVLNMTGHQHFAAKVLSIAALVNVALNAVLIPAFGTMGAASATAVSILLWHALLLYGVVRHLNVDPTLLGRN
jgi:O-antigen/teichoic acid export membrane protein